MLTHARRQSLRLALIAVILFASTMFSVALSPASSSAADAASCLSAPEQQFLTLINTYRQSKGLKPLVATKSLDIASYKHSLDMGMRRYFSHYTKLPLPAGQSGPSPWDRMRDAGYGYSTYKGENIAAGYSSAQSVFNGWKASSGHNANMLNANFRAIGIGMVAVSGSSYTYYWTTDFGGVVDAKPVCS